jgi:DNA helicase-2/ATP-dependent DNA helicase PcrA
MAEKYKNRHFLQPKPIMEMTEQQLRVINQVTGHLVVLAGPGSGKTRVIIEKIYHLFDKKIIPEPFGVLAITFTNAAANEMKTRLRQRGFFEWDRLMVATFHSFSRYLLTCYGSDIGISEDFQVADSKQQTEVVYKIKPDSNPREASSILAAIENQKKLGVYPGVGDEGLSASFRRIFYDYQNQLKQENLLDYGDLIHFSIELMNRSPLASHIFKNFFRYIFVDEFQDTDHQQLELVKIFANEAIGSTIVADDDQSVFAWRGADRKNIEVIRKYLNATSFQLGINFRSDQAIVEAANAVISQEKDREEKKIQANSQAQGKIYYRPFDNQEQEANAIASRIEKFIEKGGIEDLGQIAIIVRVRYRADKIIDILSSKNITWFDRSRLFFEDGWETVFALSLIAQACEPNSSKRYNQLLSAVDIAGIVSKYEDAIAFITSLRQEICREIPSEPSAVAIHHILDCSDFGNVLKDNCWSDTDLQNRSKNIDRLIQNIEKLAAVHKLELLETVDHLAGIGAVQILSGQESKGREFDYVFFAGLEEGTIPHYKAQSEDQISEERRIFYVAMTRARRELYLTYATEQMTSWGTTRQYTRSRFIDAIPQELIGKS